MEIDLEPNENPRDDEPDQPLSREQLLEKIQLAKKLLSERQLSINLKKYELEKQRAETLKQQGGTCTTDRVVEFNVGGQIFTALFSVLTRDVSSRLAQFFLHNNSLKDSKGRVFIDRNPTYFPYVLDFIRTDKLVTSFPDSAEEDYFNQELEYYQIGPPKANFVAAWNPNKKASGLGISDDGLRVSVDDETKDHLIILGQEKLMRGTVSVTVKVVIPRPNRYSFGVLVDLPSHYDRGFAYKIGPVGWGLHDHSSALGIYCQTQKVASSSLGYTTNDMITMIVDVDRGNLIYKVNGVKCAELLGCDMIRKGVWLAATLFNKDSSMTIIR
ncbi:putative BTB/POZ domain containing protein [Blattamonas nauphoetae]|uniref:BTB/POZ domain containing protein n=1 Tax=Blattamonas nauphoetae TaxID=2049346 RepID=A0ABQ9YC49_9EUKA|nr:putative BTB/POZ domain containing protein [Blattamonas nauphoetae]